MFEHGQWTAAVPVEAISATSRSSSHTQWATTVRSERMPRWWNTSIGRRPQRLSDSCTSQIDSEEWVCSPVSNSSASTMASAKHCGVQYMRCSSPTHARTRPPDADGPTASSSARLEAIDSK